MATTTVSNQHVLKAIANLESYVIHAKEGKRVGFLQREKEYNDKRKYIRWLVEPYDNTWRGIDDENNWYYYADDELEKAEKLKALIRLSPNGEITIDDNDASMIEYFNSLKVGDGDV